MKKITVVLIGAGSRGTIYTDKMAEFGEAFEVVAVAEPIESRREYIRNKHHIREDMCFATGEELLQKKGKVADVAVIATMDRDHFDLTYQAIKLKYHILLEKPVCPTAEQCIKLEKAAEENQVKVMVCHVLRYSKFFMQIRHLVQSGVIGEVVSVNHEECVGNVHQSHSFVRGNWGNEERSSSMLLQKSCHDMDILQWILDKKCLKVQSFGGTYYFKREHMPKDTPDYCIEGCRLAESCPYNAVKLYLEDRNSGRSHWFRTTCTRQSDPTDEDVEKAIRTTQYGKCVFKCDNNVVDHQTVNLLFEDGVTATFTMNAFNKGGRSLHIMGTKGELRAAMSGANTPITVYDFETLKTTEYDAKGTDGIVGGHGGGDWGIINALKELLEEKCREEDVSNINISVANHMIVFAAEKARREGTVVDVDEFTKTVKEGIK